MLGDVFDGLVAVFVVEGLVNRGALQRRGHIRAAGDEGGIPKLGDIKNFKFGAESFLEPDDDFLFDEIDDADEIIFAAEGKLQRNRMSAEALANGADDVIEIRAHAVHLVDESRCAERDTCPPGAIRFPIAAARRRRSRKRRQRRRERAGNARLPR